MKNKTIAKSLAMLTIFLSSAQSVFAQCTVNGREVPCEEIPKIIFILPIIMFAIGISISIFWLLMLIDAIKNQKEDRTMWILILIFLNFLGSVIYYFVEKRKRNRK